MLFKRETGSLPRRRNCPRLSIDEVKRIVDAAVLELSINMGVYALVLGAVKHFVNQRDTQVARAAIASIAVLTAQEESA
jgi:hypothetical protein